MRLYKTFDTNGGAPAVWTTSQSEASKAKTVMTKALKDNEKPHRDVDYKAVEVPTKKDDLVAFLNSGHAS